MPLTTRPLTRDDFDQSMGLIREAFGDLPPGTTPQSADDFPRPGYHAFGTFDDDHLVARVVTREYHSCFGGSAVPTGGIAGVAVTAERRGEKLLDELFRVVLNDGLRERGEAVSTLFCTAPGIYRKFGYELVSSYDTVEVPAATLARIGAPAGVRTRRATPDDFDAVREVYDAWAAEQNGPLTRRGPSFPADARAFIDAFTGVTLAVDHAGDVLGFASWRRGQGSGDSSTLEVFDLLALSGDAYGALWHVLGSFGSVVGQVRLCTSGHDVARLWLPSARWGGVGRGSRAPAGAPLVLPSPRGKVVEREPYMLRVHDVPGAFAGRDWPVDGDVAFSVAGDHLGTTNGTWRLVIDRGKATCAPAAAARGPVLTPGGLALAWAGAQTCA